MYLKSHNPFNHLGDSSLVCDIRTCCLNGKVIAIHPVFAPVRTEQTNKNLHVDRNCDMHSILYCCDDLSDDSL